MSKTLCCFCVVIGYVACAGGLTALHLLPPDAALGVVTACLIAGSASTILALRTAFRGANARVALSGFVQEQRGSVAVTFAVAVLLLTVCGAFALDITRASSARDELQAALDAATLLAAHEVDPAVVSERGQKALNANLNGQKTLINIQTTFTSNKDAVTAKATATVQPIFLGMPMKGPIDVSAQTEVKRAMNPLELALVLDTTLSMNEGGKITTLKTAATNLVNELKSDPAADVKIAVIPFAQYVNVGKSRRNSPWLTNVTDYTTTTNKPAKCTWTTPKTCQTKVENYDCSTWSDGKKTPKTCSRTVNIAGTCVNGTPYETCTPATTSNSTYTWSGCVGSPGYPKNVQDSDTTRTYPGVSASCAKEITPLTASKSTVTTAITALTVANSTYIPAGLAWGFNALSQPVPLTEGAAYDLTSPNRRPRKAIVLMTDGENTLKVAADGTHVDLSPKGSVATQANGYTAELCSNIKAAKIEVFTVAFQVTDATAKGILEGCATDAQHYFDASDSTKLLQAFKDIAGKLRDLYISK